MFAVVSKMYGSARGDGYTAVDGKDWTKEPESVRGYTYETARSICDPDWERIEPLDQIVAKLAAWKQRNEAMARGRKPSKSVAATKLAEALSFVAVAAAKSDQPYQPHVRLAGKMAVAYDGVISAGCPIEEELTYCPHAGLLIDALRRCGKSLTITELDSGRLSIKGEKLRALVPCMGAEYMPPVEPDPAIADIDDRIKTAFETVGVLVSEGGDVMYKTAILLRAGSAVATNGHAAIEYWHGIDLPPNLVLPKLFATAVLKANKKLTRFGFSEGSVTFWFEDGSWIKTQRYFDQYPAVDPILNVAMYPVDIPEGFFDGVEAVSRHHEHEYVTFTEGRVQSHVSDEIGAQWEVEGLPGGKQFQGKLLRTIAPFAKQLDLTTYGDRLFFVGAPNEQGQMMARGVVMGIIDRGEQAQQPPEEQQPEQSTQSGWGTQA